MRLQQKNCRCCGGSNFKRCGYRTVNEFFGYFALHIQPTINFRGESLFRRLFGSKAAEILNSFFKLFLKKLLRSKNEIAYGACEDCNLITVWPEFSDDQLLDFYTFYLTKEYKLERSEIDRGYSVIAEKHGSADELLMRRKQNEDFIKFYLEDYKAKSNLDTLKMLDYGGGSGQVAPSFNFIDVDLYDVGDKSIKSLKNKDGLAQLEQLPETHNSYDFVQLLHVIEHVGHPLNVVRSSLEYLKNGGLIFIEVPWEMTNFDELSEKKYITCDEHINKFCNVSLLLMMKSLGLKVLFCEGAYIKLLHIDSPIKVVRCLAKK